MEDFVAHVFGWIGQNENVLSGLVAIAVLVGLISTGVRQFTQRARGRSESASPGKASPSNAGSSNAGSSNAGPSPPPMPAIDQEIRYCRTADGLRLAYAITGEGPPVVRVMGWFTHLEQEWSSPLGRSFWQRFSREHRLIRYDGRGMGLSESTSEFSLETRLQDLDAVVSAAGLDRFALAATSEGARTALRYVARSPERVSHLILYGAAVQKSPRDDVAYNKRSAAYLRMIESGWGEASHRKLFADLFLGLSASPAEVEYFQLIQQRSASQDVAAAYYRSLFEAEQGFSVAAQVHVPTLIMHPRDDRIVPFQNSLDLAAEIPGARLRPLEGDCHFLLMQSARSEEYVEAIEAFLREEAGQAPR